MNDLDKLDTLSETVPGAAIREFGRVLKNPVEFKEFIEHVKKLNAQYGMHGTTMRMFLRMIDSKPEGKDVVQSALRQPGMFEALNALANPEVLEKLLLKLDQNLQAELLAKPGALDHLAMRGVETDLGLQEVYLESAWKTLIAPMSKDQLAAVLKAPGNMATLLRAELQDEVLDMISGPPKGLRGLFNRAMERQRGMTPEQQASVLGSKDVWNDIRRLPADTPGATDKGVAFLTQISREMENGLNRLFEGLPPDMQKLVRSRLAGDDKFPQPNSAVRLRAAR